MVSSSWRLKSQSLVNPMLCSTMNRGPLLRTVTAYLTEGRWVDRGLSEEQRQLPLCTITQRISNTVTFPCATVRPTLMTSYLALWNAVWLQTEKESIVQTHSHCETQINTQAEFCICWQVTWQRNTVHSVKIYSRFGMGTQRVYIPNPTHK